MSEKDLKVFSRRERGGILGWVLPGIVHWREEGEGRGGGRESEAK